MANKKSKKTLDWLIKKYLPFFEKFGLTKENILDDYYKWKLNRVDGIEDYLWNIFNFLLNENAKQSQDIIEFYQRNDEIYLQMLYFRRKIERKPANEIQQLLNYNRLELEIQRTPYEFDVIINATNDCEACQNLDRKIISIKNALKDKIIPYDKCKRKQGCACLYSIKLKRDENDRLIKK